jgi:hypothetical protein
MDVRGVAREQYAAAVTTDHETGRVRVGPGLVRHLDLHGRSALDQHS